MAGAGGDVDLAKVGSLLADRSRSRILLALADGRCLPASMLAGAHVGRLIEAVAAVAPAEEVRSLRAGNRAQAIRRARTCYDHLAGRLGVAITESMSSRRWVDGLNGAWVPSLARAAGAEDAVTAVLTPRGRRELADLGVSLPQADGIRCCVDWTEQRPHIAGAHGRALLDRLLALDWLRRAARSRAVHLTSEGRQGLSDVFGDHAVFAEFRA